MSTVDKRLALLEQAHIHDTERWCKSLSDADLDVLVDGIDPAERARIERLSDAELDALIAGRR